MVATVLVFKLVRQSKTLSTLAKGTNCCGHIGGIRVCDNTWERCESGRIGTPGERVFTMWTVGSNPTLSVKRRGNPVKERRGRCTRMARPVPAWWHMDQQGLFVPRMFFWGSSSVGRAPESQSGGRRFDSALLHSRRHGRRNHQTTVRVVPQYRLGSNTVVLDGELAVPCNPQSATAGSNSHPKDRTCVAGMRYSRY